MTDEIRRCWIEDDERLHLRAEEIAGVLAASSKTLMEKFPWAVQRAREERESRGYIILRDQPDKWERGGRS